MDFHVYIHQDSQTTILERLDAITAILTQQVERGEQMSVQLDTLTAEVADNTKVDESAIALLNGLSDQIAALKDDPAAIQALADELKSSSDALAAAVVANTPVAP